MKYETIAKRLQIALTEANISQQELSEKSGVGKSSISHYVNGTHAPSNISAGKMAAVLDVEPLWLMGFDVPKQKISYDFSNPDNIESISNFLTDIVTNYDLENQTKKRIKTTNSYINSIVAHLVMLNDDGKQEAVNRIEELTHIPKYQKTEPSNPITQKLVEMRKSLATQLLAAAHDRTDIEVTDEMKKHDDDIMNNDSEWE